MEQRDQRCKFEEMNSIALNINTSGASSIINSKDVHPNKSTVLKSTKPKSLQPNLKVKVVKNAKPKIDQNGSQSQPNVKGKVVQSDSQSQPNAKVKVVKNDSQSQPNVKGKVVQSDSQSLPNAKVKVVKNDSQSQPNVKGELVQNDSQSRVQQNIVKIMPSESQSSEMTYNVGTTIKLNDSNDVLDDSVIPDYDSPNNSALEGERTQRKPRRDMRWFKEKTYKLEDEALLTIRNEMCWSQHNTNESHAGHSVMYRCNKVKAKGQQCSSGIYLLYHAESEDVTLFRSRNDHDCQNLPPRGKPGISPEVEEAIRKYVGSGMNAKDIMNALHLEGLPVPSKNPLNNLIANIHRENDGPSIISIAELDELLKAHIAIPEDENEAFVVEYKISDENEIGFDFFVSSKKLLRNAIGKKVFACDASYKILWQGFPIIPLGTIDMDRHFHIIGIAAANHEKTENFEFVFRSIKKKVFDIWEIEIHPDTLIADGSKAIQNAFLRVFGDDCLILMCWFHMKKNIRENIGSLLPKQLHDQVLQDIDKLQISQNPNMFEKASKLFLQKYAELPTFVEYFESEWLRKNRNWYEGASPSLVPSTNNAEESFNRVFKDRKTLRKRLPLHSFIEKLQIWIKSFSVEYDSGAKAHFIEKPTIDLPLWTKSYQWVHLKKVITKSKDNPKILIIPAGEENTCLDLTIGINDWRNFDDFKKLAFISWEVDTSEEDWMKWICNCPSFIKKYLCKHVIGVALRMKFVAAPMEAKTVPIGSKRKRGRPAKAKRALLVQ